MVVFHPFRHPLLALAYPEVFGLYQQTNHSIVSQDPTLHSNSMDCVCRRLTNSNAMASKDHFVSFGASLCAGQALSFNDGETTGILVCKNNEEFNFLSFHFALPLTNPLDQVLMFNHVRATMVSPLHLVHEEDHYSTSTIVFLKASDPECHCAVPAAEGPANNTLGVANTTPIFFPYGQQNFAEIQKAKQTHVIPVFEKAGTHTTFLCPSHFGKSLLNLTLHSYYHLHQKHKFNNLFRDLYIGKNLTPLKNCFYVLPLDFSIDTTSTTLTGISGALHDKINYSSSSNKKFICSKSNTTLYIKSKHCTYIVYSYFSYSLILNAFPIIDKMQKNFHTSNLLLLPIISRLVYNSAYNAPSLKDLNTQPSDNIISLFCKPSVNHKMQAIIEELLNPMGH
ncbi:hypothetical protein QOT17_023005 [Balamuthia mandrillaris]